MTGNDLKALRKSMGLTHTEFAVKVGKTANTIRNWEGHGKKQLSTSTCILIQSITK